MNEDYIIDRFLSVKQLENVQLIGYVIRGRDVVDLFMMRRLKKMVRKRLTSRFRDEMFHPAFIYISTLLCKRLKLLHVFLYTINLIYIVHAKVNISASFSRYYKI